MQYPITVEVLHQVFSPYGFVEKIVTFQKSAGQLLQVFSLSLSLSLKLEKVYMLFIMDKEFHFSFFIFLSALEYRVLEF